MKINEITLEYNGRPLPCSFPECGWGYPTIHRGLRPQERSIVG